MSHKRSSMKKDKRSSSQESASGGQAGGEGYHVPVLLQETIDALQVKANGVYVDCTFGGGGHGREILKRLGADGKLVAFDQDADAKQNAPDDARLVFVPHNFRHLQRFLRLH